MSYRNPNPAKVEVVKKLNSLVDCLINIQDETGEFLMTIPDGRVIDTKGWNDWEWTHGIGLYGLFKFWEVTSQPEPFRTALAWYIDRFRIGTTKNVNTMSPFLVAAHFHSLKISEPNLFQRVSGGTGDHINWIYHLESWGNWAMDELPRTESGGWQHTTYLGDHEGQMWDDTLMMCALPLAKIGKVLGRETWVEEAKRQFLVHARYLEDDKTGLWFHAWTFNGRHHFSNALWARGNCWITIAIPDLLELLGLPPTDSFYIHLSSILRSQVSALVNLQDADTRMWHTILNDNTSYLEASATAGFAYGILKGVRMGLFPKKDRTKYLECGTKAAQSILENITTNGELSKVSFGTPVFDSLEGYKNVPLTSMPYGQSLGILALTEYYRTLW